MNNENLKIAIEEIINHKNYKYFIKNFDFETRKDFIENIETYNDYLEELLITDENLSIFSKNIFTPEEAESLYKNINSYDEIKSLFIIFNLSDERKESIIKNTPYDEDYKDLIIDSINDEKTKDNLKKFYNLDEHIKNLTDEEKLSLINSLEKDYNKLKVLKTIKDELKYEYIINNNLDEYQIKELSESIKNEEILYNIIILDNIKNSSILNEFIELLSDEYKSKTLKTLLSSEGNININDEIVNIILNMESKYQKEFLLNEELYFNKEKFDYFKTKEIFSKIDYTDNIIDFVYKMVKNKTMPISFVNNNIKSDIIKLKIIKEQEIILDNTDLETMFNSLKTETYIKECIPLIINKISITKIIKKIPTDQEKLSFIETLSDEQLKEIQQKQYKELFNEETTLVDLFSNENIKLNLLDSEKISILESLSDETKLNIINSNHKLLNNSKDYKLRLIISLNDDNKVKLIEENKIDSYLNIAVVLSKIKDEKYNQYKIDKLIELLFIARKKGDTVDNICYSIISSFDNEEIKFNLINEIYGLELESKSLILSTLKKEQYDIEKIKFIEENKALNYSNISHILKSIQKKELIINLFESDILDIKKKIFILTSLEDIIFDDIKSKILKEVINDENVLINDKLHLINSIKDNRLKLDSYIKLNIFEYINFFILHNDYILTEKEIIEPIIDVYSNKYIVNKEHLTIMVKKYGYEVIRAIENDNIKNIINSNEDIFNKLIEIFDIQNTLLVEDKHIDSVLYALLQRDFRTNEEETLNIFNKIKDTIENNNYEETIKSLKEIKEFLDSKNANYIPDILIKHNIYDYNKLIVNTFDKEKQNESLSIINELTNKYILEKRNEHSNNKYKEFKNSLELDKTYEKNTLIKEFIVKESITKIKELILSIENISDEEKNLIENEEILSDCINLKRGLNTNNSKVEVIKYIKRFNNLLEKLYLEKKLNYIGNESIKAIYNIPKNNGSIVNIFKELDIDLLNEKLFNNDELFKELIAYLKNYRLVGWGSTFSELADKVDMDLDESTIASFINNFYKISEVLNKKLEERNKDLEEDKKRKITLTEFLEEAEVYGSDSYKYKILLGQEDYRLIRTNPPNNASPMQKKERLTLSAQKTIEMYKREFISIPPADININLENNKVLNYSVGYTKETTNLTYGERTGACMRIGGAADGLFNICLSNENGFHIKITDPNTNKFISRVSGFRNGNTIFLNQLRNSTSKEFTNEDLIEGLKTFMDNIIKQTSSSTYPIENIIISDGFAMSGREKLDDLKINIQEGFERFRSDVSNTNAILLTSSTSSLMPIKLGVENRELYETARLKVQKIDNKKTIILTINRLKMINELLNGISLENTTIYDENNTIFNNAKTMHYGEDWYILLDEDNNVIEEFTIDYKEKDKALNELEELKQSLSIGGKIL